MKVLRIFLLFGLLSPPFWGVSQISLSDEKRKIIVEQLKREILDSLKSHGEEKKSDTLGNLKVSGYVETYFCYDFANPQNNVRQPFIYSHNRSTEFNLNLGFIKLSYENQKVRTALAFMAGTYANDNLAGEKGVLKNVMEATIGVHLSKKKNLWLDAGIFSSHIGFESAISKDCWNLTRSLLADNSPYYETGIKLGYLTENKKWFLSALVLNGWQKIYKADGNHLPAFGHQVTYSPSNKISLNSSSFIGSDQPDSSRKMRYFHNFYSKIQFHEKIGLIAGFDMGAEQKMKGSSNYHFWWSPILILRYTANNKISLAARAEYYNDQHGVIIYTGSAHGFKTAGYSINFDYLITNELVWRIEARGLYSRDKIFSFQKNPTNYNLFLTTSLAIAF